MPTGTKARNKSQLALDETIVEDDELLQALLEREKRRAAALELGREYEEADKHAKALLEPKLVELVNAEALRIGDFRISREETKPRTVRFESKAHSRIRIEAIKPGDDD